MESNNIESRKDIGPAGDSHLASLSVFNGSRHFAFIYKKTEKLVTAIYMITNFIQDSEPLKWAIRERALDLMSLNMSFNTVSLSERKALLKEYQAIAIELVSHASIAHHAGLISEMNFSILKREFEALVHTIERDENKKANEETVFIHPNFFDEPIIQSPEARGPESRPAAPASFAAPRPAPQPKQESRQENVLYKGHEKVERPSASYIPKVEPKASKPVQKDTPAKESSGDRKQAILSLLAKKEGLNIQDFTDVITGVSSKTIQRELLGLVAAGVLKKEGERRWSRYFLAK